MSPEMLRLVGGIPSVALRRSSMFFKWAIVFGVFFGN